MPATAACVNTECPEHGVPKDMSMMPPGFTPVLCGACGQVIPVDDDPDPQPRPGGAGDTPG
jgi:hypothetical protein